LTVLQHESAVLAGRDVTNENAAEHGQSARELVATGQDDVTAHGPSQPAMTIPGTTTGTMDRDPVELALAMALRVASEAVDLDAIQAIVGELRARRGGAHTPVPWNRGGSMA
jgi:hypothetical protein